MNPLEQKVGWQHLVLIASAGLLFAGGIILSIHLSGTATPKTTPWPVGAAFIAGAGGLSIFAIASLRRTARREEMGRLLAVGLFELPPGASEATCRLNAALASHFALSRDDFVSPVSSNKQTLDYAPRTPMPPPRRPWPATFDELSSAINDRLEHARLPVEPFVAARAALADALGRHVDDIRWSDRLAELIPPGRQRFIVWERLRSRAPSLPPVDLNPWVENIAIYTFFAALIAIAVPIAQSMDRNESTRIENPGVGARLLGRAFGLVLFAVIIAVLMIPVYAIGRRYAARLPRGFDTIASLVPHIPLSGEARLWTRADVESHLRDLVAAALNRPPSEIVAATKL
jgi:hypothetical protein